jgi:hypothetical protein
LPEASWLTVVRDEAHGSRRYGDIDALKSSEPLNVARGRELASVRGRKLAQNIRVNI